MAARHLFCLDQWEARNQAPVLSQVSGGYQQVSCEALAIVHLIYRGLSLSFFSSRQKAALQLDRPVWKTAGSIYTFCLQVERKGHVHRRTRKEINNMLEVWGFFSDLNLTRFKY